MLAFRIFGFLALFVVYYLAYHDFGKLSNPVRRQYELPYAIGFQAIIIRVGSLLMALIDTGYPSIIKNIMTAFGFFAPNINSHWDLVVFADFAVISLCAQILAILPSKYSVMNRGKDRDKISAGGMKFFKVTVGTSLVAIAVCVLMLVYYSGRG